MKRVFAFIVLFFFSLTLHADNLLHIKTFSLNKDEETKIFVRYEGEEKVFTLRWTLYVNEGLVIFHAYKKRVFQNILYLNRQNQSFKVYLKTQGEDDYESPYLFVKFKKFQKKKHKAIFEIFLFDFKNKIKLRFQKKVS